MNGPALFQLFVTVVGLAIVIGLLFAALEFRPIHDPYKRFAKMAIGGAAFLIIVLALGAFFFGGGAKASNVTPGGIIEFAISVIALYAVLYFVDIAIDYFKVPFPVELKLFLTFVGLLIIMWAAYMALVGGGIGFIKLGGLQQRTSLITNRVAIHDLRPYVDLTPVRVS